VSFWANIQQYGDAPPVNSLPANVVLPSISGLTPIGSVLTCNPGEWSGTPTPSITYQWRRGSSNISGATGSTYTTQAADQDQAVTCRVTATNIVGSANAVSSNSIVPLAAPVATANPVITGTPAVGSTLTCSTGTFSGSAPITYAYQWFANAVAISGATGSTYVPVEADQGKAVTCRVTASNSVGSSSATSNAVSIALLPKINITYGGSNTSESNATTYSFTAQLGNDTGADRYAFVCVGGRGGATRSITGVTIGGSAAIILANTGACDDPQVIARSANPVPDGSSIAVSVTFNGEMARYGAASYGVRTGGAAPTVFDTIIVSDAGSADPTGTIDIEKNGGVIASAYGGNGNAITTSWTGVTENCDFATENNGNRFSAGNYMAVNAETNRRITANFSGNNNDSMLAVSLSP
jgi:hypothetical protein